VIRIRVGPGRHGRARSAALGASVVVAGVGIAVLASALSDGGPDSPGRSAEPVRSVSVAGVELFPLPPDVVAACQDAAGQAKRPVLCPTRLPRPSRYLAHAAFPPGPFDAFPQFDARGRVAGVNLSYSAETGNPLRDRPERFLHFDFQTLTDRDELPPGVRPVTLGGLRGLLAPATGRDYAAEPFFANHVRFFWRGEGVRYAATLHNFGPGTRAVLSALVAGLRPPEELSTEPPALSPGVRSISVPVNGPVAVAAAPGVLWVAGAGSLGRRPDPQGTRWSALAGIDPDSGEVVSGPTTIANDLGPSALAVDGASLWVAHNAVHRAESLRRLDPAGAEFTQSIEAAREQTALALSDEALWAVDLGGWPGDPDYRGGSVTEFDPRSGRALAEIVVGRAPAGIALAADSLWVTNHLDDSVSRIDPSADRVVVEVPVGRRPTGIAAGYGAIWVANHGDGTVSRIDPETNEVSATIAVGEAPRGIAAGEGGVWVTNGLDDTVSRIDPTAGRVVETIRVPAGPTGIETGHGAVWVASTLDRKVSAIEP
jgi:YVTN family beta-propeller protein